MPILDIFTPTKERGFTFYDRCAIALDSEEMTASRIRVFVELIGSPLVLSQNFKYPVPQTWFGYAQGWFQGWHLWDKQIQYPKQCVYDYWNEHSSLAHQLTEVCYQLFLILDVVMTSERDRPGTLEGIINLLNDFIDNRLERLKCLVIEPIDGISPPYVNTFQQPCNVLRFNFPPGTVFNVYIQSWNMGETSFGVRDGSDNTDEPYDVFEPQEYLPERTPGGNDPETSYGPDPIPSSPFDPNLDPADYSNAPEPEPPEFQLVRISGSFVQRQGGSDVPLTVNQVFGPFRLVSGCVQIYQSNTSEASPRPMDQIVVSYDGGLTQQLVSNILSGTLTITLLPVEP